MRMLGGARRRRISEGAKDLARELSYDAQVADRQTVVLHETYDLLLIIAEETKRTREALFSIDASFAAWRAEERSRRPRSREALRRARRKLWALLTRPMAAGPLRMALMASLLRATANPHRFWTGRDR